MREAGWTPVQAWLERIHDRLTLRETATGLSHPLRRRSNSVRFSWICRHIPVEAATPSTRPFPWQALDRKLAKTEVGAFGRAAGPVAF